LLLALRAQVIVPLLGSGFRGGSAEIGSGGTLDVCWRFGKGDLRLRAALTDTPPRGSPKPDGRLLFATHPADAPWSVIWTLSDRERVG
jgi:hypothetical protein